VTSVLWGMAKVLILAQALSDVVFVTSW
jgi:hypothetical protein